MMASEFARTFIRSFEGESLKAYPDPGTGGDPWTIGVGATGAGISRGTVWTQQQVNDRFNEDVDRFSAGVTALIDGHITTQSQFDAMVSLSFNIGLRNLASSTLLKKHLAADFIGAAAEFLKWNKAAGKVMPGLTKRREAEARMYGNMT